MESFEYYTMLEEDKRRFSWGKIVILMLKKMMLLDDERVSFNHLYIDSHHDSEYLILNLESLMLTLNT